ncbi:MAG: gephyrin-like molybdotransferase Glp [Aestuariibacter sp.]
MDCCDTHGLPPVDTAVNLILSHCVSIQDTETVPLEQASGRIAAQDIRATLAVPQYHNSAMDGYALRYEDTITNCPLSVVGQSFAGAPYSGSITKGQCVRIMTGAMIPNGADTVIKQEDVIAEQQNIILQRQPKYGESIRRAGEDISPGSALLSAGTRLSPYHIGLLAACGQQQIPVFRKLKIAVMSTGNELVDAPAPLSGQQIYDTNRPAIKALLAEYTMLEIIDLGIIPDGQQQLTASLMHANEIADVVISSGGVSVGEADYTKDVLQELGQIHLWRVAIKPGKPLVFGQLPDSLFFGLPGNPVSAIVTLQQIVLQALLKLSGTTKMQSVRVSATSLAPIKKRPGRTDFQRGIYTQDEHQHFSVTPLAHQGSGVFSSMTKANCYIVLPQEQGDVAENEKVVIEPF